MSELFKDSSIILSYLGSRYRGIKLHLSAGSTNNGLQFAFVGNGSSSQHENDARDTSSGANVGGVSRVTKSNEGAERLRFRKDG